MSRSVHGEDAVGVVDSPRAKPAIVDTFVSSWMSLAGGAERGGDWCEVVNVSDDVLALTVGDVAGHGESVGHIMASLRDATLAAISRDDVPSTVLEAANREAARFFAGDGVIVTAIVAFLNHRLRTLTFANAGHPPPLMMTADRAAFLQQRPADLPLGVYPYHHSANYVVAVPLDAVVLFYTDGITEHARDPIAGEIELAEATRYIYQRPEVDLARAVGTRVLRRARGDDDAAILAVRMIPAAGKRSAGPDLSP